MVDVTTSGVGACGDGGLDDALVLNAGVMALNDAVRCRGTATTSTHAGESPLPVSFHCGDVATPSRRGSAIRDSTVAADASTYVVRTERPQSGGRCVAGKGEVTALDTGFRS